MSDSKDEGIVNRNLSRRSLLKWSGALAAAGIVGIGLGIGGDLLIRPSTTKTTTSTATGPTTTTTKTVSGPTTTVTVPPATLSYVPPLSPSVQTYVNQIIQDKINAHQGETYVYSRGGEGTAGGDPAKMVMKDGVLTGVIPDDTLNPTIAREDAYLSQDDLNHVRIRGIPYLFTWTWPSLVNMPDRILYPMQRTGPRGDPINANFVRITWDQAISTIVSQVESCASKYGPYSISCGGGGPGTSEFFFNSYLANLPAVGYGTMSGANEMFAVGDVLGFSPISLLLQPPSTVDQMNNSKLIILWGADPTECVGKWPMYYFSLAKEKGTPIIVIDIKYTMTAQTFANQFIPIRPNTDMAMMLAIANVLFKENLWDQDYVSKFVEPTGFANWQAYVLGNAPGYDGSNGTTSPDGAIDRTPEWAEGICGVPAATITALAELYGSTKPTALDYGFLGGHSRAMNEERAAIYLQAMTGNIGVPGGNYGCGVPGAPNPIAGAPSIAPSSPFQSLPYLFVGTEQLNAILLRDDYQSGTITKEQYYSTIGENINSPAPNIHIISNIFGSNSPGKNLPQMNKYMQAVKEVDFVVYGAYHMHAAVALSDIVLPLTDYMEVPSKFDAGNLGGINRGMEYEQHLLDPEGEARESAWAEQQVANGLGVGANCYPQFQNVAWSDWNSTITASAQAAYEAWAASDAVKAVVPSPPSWDDFAKTPIIRADCPYPPYIPFQDNISNGTAFGTPSGKIEFYDASLETFDQSQAGPDMSALSSGLWGRAGPIAPMAIWEVPENGYTDPNVSTYPLYFTNSHRKFGLNGVEFSNPMGAGESYRVDLWMSVADASARGIVDGDLVRVFNDVNEMVIPAYVTSRMVPGALYTFLGAAWNPNSDSLDLGGCPSTLTDCQLPQSAAGQAARNILVQMEKYQYQAPEGE